MKGPGLRVNERVFGASLLDICPTLLTLFGLPPGRDMDGKVLVTAFEQPPRIEPIESWDNVPGDSGTHPVAMRLDPVASAGAFRQLVALGYVAPPAANAQQAVEESVCELKYNLARAYRDGNCCGEAAALAEALWTRWPREHRFGILLVDCLGALRQVVRRRTVIEELGRRIEQYQAEAAEELKIQSSEVPEQHSEGSADPRQLRAQFEQRRLRELAFGCPLLIEWFLLSQALLEKRPAEARRCLAKIAEAGVSSDALNERIAGTLAQLGDLDAARALLETVLQSDAENPLVHSQLAAI